jgi:hypothetical protein
MAIITMVTTGIIVIDADPIRAAGQSSSDHCRTGPLRGPVFLKQGGYHENNSATNGCARQSRGSAMKTYLGVSLAAAIVVLSGTAFIGRAEAGQRSGPVAARSVALTDVSAAQRGHRSHRHRHHRPRVYVRGPYRPYYQRPSYYVPQGPAPFYPFGFGYGLDPSW